MALTPTNITGTELGWLPTLALRLYGKKRKDAALQQQWRHVSTGAKEWRDIVLVHPQSTED